MATKTDFDTGSILGNLFNDIKHIPERTIQQSRAMRNSSRLSVIEDERRRAQELKDKLAGVGLDPSQFPDEKSAIAAYLPKYAGLQRSERLKDIIAQYGQELKQKAGALGLPVSKPHTIQPGGGLIPNGGPAVETSAEVPVDTLAQNVGAAEEARKVRLAGQESAARAAATDPYEAKFTGSQNFAVNGDYVGNATRNNRTGEYGIPGPDGKVTPLPEGAQPITATSLNKNIVSAGDFRKFKEGVTDSERSLRQFGRYAESLGGMQQGTAGLADKFTAGMKTLLGNGDLNPQELQRAAATGQLQGLLGGNRVSVVGGGVMTETDAQRIIQRLGGDVGALQNKAVVMKALSELYQDRYAQYDDDYNFYNEAVDSYWGAKGFKKAKRTEYDKLFGQPAENGSVTNPATPNVAQPQGTSATSASSPFKILSVKKLN